MHGLSWNWRVVRPIGFEPMTVRLEGGCSIQLSYGRPNAALVFACAPVDGNLIPAFNGSVDWSGFATHSTLAAPLHPVAGLSSGRMREFDLIARLKPLLPANDSVVAGAGDDCAVLDLGDPLHHTLFKTDAVVEGIHFTPGTDPEQVGHKAIARCLSDIAAMGGQPTAAVVTLGLPDGHPVEWSEALYRGLCRTAARFHVAVVGGETTTVPDRTLVSVSMIGRVPRGMARMRSMAEVGDALLVSGELGGSIDGHHLTFEPRLAEGAWLARQAGVHALIDLSDGLAGDLRQILQASGNPGAEVFGAALPISRSARLRARAGDLARPALLAALTDGEDFELLFTVARGAVVPVMDGWRSQFPHTRITCIGRITAGPEVLLQDATGMRPMPRGGYEHFPAHES